MLTTDHDRAISRLYAAAESRWRWQFTWLPLLRWLVPVAAALALAALAVTADCGDVAWGDPLCVAGGEVQPGRDGPGRDGGVDCLPARGEPDVEAFALAGAVLAWQPTAMIRADAVRAVAVEVVAACREVVGTALGDDCPALMMALAWRESAFRADVTGRAPWRACGIFQLHGAALDTWTCAEARGVRRNTMLAADWLRQCVHACRDLPEALTMYASGNCHGDRRARWSVRRLLRMAREMREVGR